MRRIHLYVLLLPALLLPAMAADANCPGKRTASVKHQTGKEKGFDASKVNIPELERLIADLETAPPEERKRIEAAVRNMLQIAPKSEKDAIPDGYFEYNGRRYRLRC